ncbi:MULTISPECIES: aromatic amino acid DMT transporter YddG [Comamonas]|uniref:aromatic amino acid DMT transporter YddG n=1 Tax=Comamonas TaxID=283 RepID=UPI00257D07F4|nr:MULTISPECIES: aromatic amino acid DMT transporter YddG [Comamonas]
MSDPIPASAGAASAAPISATPAAVQRATLVGLVAVLCWSATVGLMRSVAEALGALGGAAVLYSVSAVLVLLVQGLPTRAQLRSISRVYLVVCGLLFACYEICLSVAIGLAHDRPQSMELGMINYLWPCLTIVLAVLCRQQHARWWLWPGVALCLWGLVLVVGADGNAAAGAAAPWWYSFVAHMAANPLAYALAFGAALMWPTYSVLARMHGGGFNGVGLFLLLTAALLWVQWLALDTVPMRWSWGTAAQVLAIGALTALGYGCWEHGIQRGNLAVMAAGSYFTPVLSSLWASVWLAVQPGLPFWQGVVLVTSGSLVCWAATRSRS